MRLTSIAAISGVLLGLASLRARADESGAPPPNLTLPPDLAPPPDDDWRARGNCQSVDAHIVSTFFVDGCASPVGICTQGTIDSGLLAGTTVFTVLTADSPNSPDILQYTGEFVITTLNGVLTIHDTGVFDQANGVFFEMDPIVSGTGAFTNAAGPLFSVGRSTPTGFDGAVIGVICGVPQDAVPEDT
jgi:hypothetical protein